MAGTQKAKPMASPAAAWRRPAIRRGPGDPVREIPRAPAASLLGGLPVHPPRHGGAHLSLRGLRLGFRGLPARAAGALRSRQQSGPLCGSPEEQALRTAPPEVTAFLPAPACDLGAQPAYIYPSNRIPVRVPPDSLADAPLYFVTDHALTAGRPQLEVIRGGPGRRRAAWCSTGTRISGEPDFIREARAAAGLVPRDTGAAADQRPGGSGQGHRRRRRAPWARTIWIRRTPGDMLGPDAIIGLSTHNREEVLAARDKPLDYINIGPMFPTATKDHSRYGALGAIRCWSCRG